MKAIVVHKTSKLSVLKGQSPERVAELAEHDSDAYRSMLDSESRQREASQRVVDALDTLGFTTVSLSRVDFRRVAEDVDLVVAVGGDGTVLDVSHKVGRQPLIGINSDPKRSVGYFCAGDATEAREAFRRFADGVARRYTLHRLSLHVDGERYPYPCMNDILVTNRNPAMMSRYVVTAGQRSEKHASSGMWISTPAGSTAGIRSAGGTVMPLEGALIQYLVREPYTTGAARYPLLRGVRHLHEGLHLRSLMEGGALYVDGPYMEIPFPIGAELEITEGPALSVLELDPMRRER